MPRIHVHRVIKASAKIKRAWSDRPTFTMGDLKLERFNAAHGEVLEVDAAIAAKRHELRALLSTRTEKVKVLNDLTTRTLSAFRGAFGPDSPEYRQAGGVRRGMR